MILALGADFLIKKMKSAKLWSVIIICFSFVYAVNYFYFLDEYFVHTPKHNSQYWDFGYKQVVEAVTPIQANYKKIVIKQSYAQPFIFFLFYQKYDPVKFQKIADKVFLPSKFGDVGLVTHLDNLEFRQIDWPLDRRDHGTLFVADPIQIPPDDSKDESQFKLIKEIKYLNDLDTAFRIIEVK